MLRAALVACLCLAALPARAGAGDAQHGQSLFGALKYPAGFRHFEYAHLNAPKGGRGRIAVVGGFDSFNPFVFKGRAAAQIGIIYDTLMTDSFDEPASQYGLVAESVRLADDGMSVLFTLRAEARFHDGAPITPADVIWSLETLKANHPFYRAYYADILRGEAEGIRGVRFIFATNTNRELPFIAGQLRVLPKHYWEEAGRDISAANLDAPLGSGPYRLSDFKPGAFVEYERVADYWARDLPVNKGRHNLARIRIVYFGDSTVALEAFKAGKIDIRFENSSKNWALAYKAIAEKDPALRLEEVPTRQPAGMQGFVFNLRRSVFQSRDVRAAFAQAFDFEWLNKNLFFGQYTRTQSYFDASELASRGLPKAGELAFLEPLRDALPAEVFTRVFRNPKTKGTGANRTQLRRAARLFKRAGWRVRDGKLVHETTGRAMAVEFLLVDPSFERVVLPFTRSLRKLGVEASVRVVDTAQYRNRLLQYDFDIIVHGFGQSLSPGNEQRDFWGSKAAKQPGGRNMAGISSPAIDTLIEHVVDAQGRDALLHATRALDRALLWGHYVVPHWHIPYTRLAYRRPLAHPDPLPAYQIGFPSLWWRAE